jgi:hypothetical protein
MSEPGTKAPVRVGPRMVPLDDLLPHPLNSNLMSADLQAKLCAHIKRTGRYPGLPLVEWTPSKMSDRCV